ncbi:MAG TPA: hypothetical protein VFI47_16325 [Acidimicrobiales bacterium]|nr:hypothetical protein [Acidimicrobiales bacterium]
MALLAAIAACTHAFHGITNAALRHRMTGLWHPGYSSAQATYDLQRLRRNGLLTRDPGTHRYQLTHHGRRLATLFTRVGARVLVPTLTQLADSTRPPRGSPARLVAASRAYDHELDQLLKHHRAAARPNFAEVSRKGPAKRGQSGCPPRGIPEGALGDAPDLPLGAPTRATACTRAARCIAWRLELRLWRKEPGCPLRSAALALPAEA